MAAFCAGHPARNSPSRIQGLGRRAFGKLTRRTNRPAMAGAIRDHDLRRATNQAWDACRAVCAGQVIVRSPPHGFPRNEREAAKRPKFSRSREGLFAMGRSYDKRITHDSGSQVYREIKSHYSENDLWQKAFKAAKANMPNDDVGTGGNGAGSAATSTPSPVPSFAEWMELHGDWFRQHVGREVPPPPFIYQDGEVAYVIMIEGIRLQMEAEQLAKQAPPQSDADKAYSNAPTSWNELKPLPLLIDGKNVDNFQDWKMDHNDWYNQHVGKDFPSIEQIKILTAESYMPYLEATYLDSLENKTFFLGGNENTYLDIHDAVETDRMDLWEIFLDDKYKWLDENKGKKWLMYGDWSSFIEHGYMALLEYVRAGNKINYPPPDYDSNALPSEPNPITPSNPRRDGELKLLSVDDGSTSSSDNKDLSAVCGVDRSHCGSAAKQGTACGVKVTFYCSANGNAFAACGTAVGAYSATASFMASCGVKANPSLFTASTSKYCAAAFTACMLDASAIILCGGKIGACYINAGVASACGVAGGLCGFKYSSKKFCGADWSNCLIKNSTNSQTLTSVTSCMVDTGDWCLFNFSKTPGLSWCYMNTSFR
ncbi:hypothetical protein [Methylobacterium sp. SD21]|uniref:hypothetical protein n=1 Tax=Methylobacterium litchii TaxID=3138810 RepID=UPI00313E014D